VKSFVLCILLSGVTVLAQDPLVFDKAIPLPDVHGRFDHFSADVAGQRLAVAALGNDTVELFDLAAGTRLASSGGQKKPCGLLFIPEEARLVVTNGGDGSVRGFETAMFRQTTQLDGLDDADNLRADVVRGHTVAGFGEGGLALLSKHGDALLGKVPLPAHPEAFQIESKGPRAFVNVPGVRAVAAVDLEKLEVVATWPLEKWRANFPMSYDEEHARLFIGCRSPARLLMLDTRSGSVTGECEIGGDTDDLYFDAKRGCVYVSCGEGFLDTIKVENDGRLNRIAHQPTRVGARTCYYSAALDRLYLAVPAQPSGDVAELRIYHPAQ
jgi:hypothetical protein